MLSCVCHVPRHHAYHMHELICVVCVTGEDPVGPQNWFKDAQGQAAQALPKEDVGPHLPPGGTPWPPLPFVCCLFAFASCNLPFALRPLPYMPLAIAFYPLCY